MIYCARTKVFAIFIIISNESNEKGAWRQDDSSYLSLRILFTILSFSSLCDVRQIMSVNNFSLRCLSNGKLYKIIKNSVRRGQCFSHRLDRGTFWTGLVDAVVRQENNLHIEKDSLSYQQMLEQGKNGKWSGECSMNLIDF